MKIGYCFIEKKFKLGDGNLEKVGVWFYKSFKCYYVISSKWVEDNNEYKWERG